MMLISGGVDSTVGFAMLNKFLGSEKVFGLFVDNGFLRKNEVKIVLENLKQIGSNINFCDASEEFLSAFDKVYDPEQKRKIIGKLFLDIVAKEEKKIMQNNNMKDVDWLLGQGTIYPDVIESKGTKNSKKIKTHHNRIKFIQKMMEENKVIEPLKNFYKDEVREIGLALGLPNNLIFRHPFPGPGLSPRCLCSNKSEEIKINLELGLLNPDEDFCFKNNVFQTDIFQGVVLPIKSVGVQGDERTYKHPITIFATQKTIEEGLSDFEKLENISTKLTNRFSEINRVIYLISHNYISNNICLFEKYITKERIELIREIDNIVYDIFIKNEVYDKIWQCPVVLIPVGIISEKNEKLESVVIRPICSNDGMTANFAKIEKKIIIEIAQKIKENFREIAFVFYDITNKPPGTIEWE